MIAKNIKTQKWVRKNKMMFCEYPDVVGIREVQKMLKIGRNKVYELLRKNEIKSIRIGNKYIIPKQSVIEFVENKLL